MGKTEQVADRGGGDRAGMPPPTAVPGIEARQVPSPGPTCHPVQSVHGNVWITFKVRRQKKNKNKTFRSKRIFCTILDILLFM